MSTQLLEKPLQQCWLSSNGWRFQHTSDMLAPLEPWSGAGYEDLRADFLRKGVLLLKEIIPRTLVNATADAYLDLFPASFFKQGTRRSDGIYSGTEPHLQSYGCAGHPAYEFVRTRQFEALCDAPELARVASALLNTPVCRLRRSPLRHFVRGGDMATRAHTDFPYVDRGTDKIVTIWVPLLPCGLNNAPLVYLEDSQSLDLMHLRRQLAGRTDRAETQAIITNDLGGLAELTGRRWLYGELEPGDVLVHGPQAVHASLDCTSDHMRVSTDLRFIPKSDLTDERWTGDWAADDGF